ncbi:MAG: alpha-hydroxy-acid oxidizing protein [Alphaproteobacteria bacterium]|nr:alpha-hydroxy-acid oxidizing protein [Alphaproteobacteria bacterium]
MTEPINLADYEALAAERLPVMVRDYYASGALDERTLRDNLAAWRQIRLRHRVLRGVGQRSTATTLLGAPLQLPLGIAPMAFQAMAHPEGERATARAAAEAGALMVLSTMSNHPVEAVAVPGAPLWFQLYVYRDRGLTRALVQRAEAAGCQALVFTVDAPVLGTRERDRRNRFHLPEGLEMGNLIDHLRQLRPGDDDSGLAAYVHELVDPDLTWETLDWLRAHTTLPVLLKGVAHPDDAREALDRGAAGVIVSNHGGRQLDGGVPTAELLPAVAAAVGERGVVMVDGGIRRGGDILRALALGADAALVGRPALWGLAVDGQVGVTRVLDILRRELDETMALCGCRDLSEVTAALLG